MALKCLIRLGCLHCCYSQLLFAYCSGQPTCKPLCSFPFLPAWAGAPQYSLLASPTTYLSLSPAIIHCPSHLLSPPSNLVSTAPPTSYLSPPPCPTQVHPSNHRPSHLKLKHFEFAGKVVGKCLYESAVGNPMLVKARFTRSFLAQIIGLRINYQVEYSAEWLHIYLYEYKCAIL